MSQQNGRNTPSCEKLPSGIAGLDAILHGGFLRGGIYIVQGEPGTGKTILGNQLCFNHAARGGKTLYVTLLAESHSRMLMHIGGLQFFDAKAIPSQVYYISAFPELESKGIEGLMQLLRREVHAHGADLLVLDGLVAAESHAGSDMAIKKFIHELQAQAAMQDCTMFLLTSSGPSFVTPEHTMVDGVVELCTRLNGWRAERELHVIKRRGGGYLRGRHAYRIGGEGVLVFPRTEALLSRPPPTANYDLGGIPTGLPQLDAMTGGGLPRFSTTMLAGPAGCGKSTTGLQFLGECSAQEPGLFLSFHETERALRQKATELQLAVSPLIEAGAVELMWQPTTEGLVDEALMTLFENIRRRGVRRLFIDGYEGLQKLAPDPGRVGHIFTALSAELRVLGVTTLFSAQTDSLLGSESGVPLSGLSHREVSSLAENIIAMRFVERGVDLHRMVSVIKVRQHRIDSRLRVFEMSGRGVVIDADPRRAVAVLRQTAARHAGALDPADAHGAGPDRQDPQEA